MAWYILHFLDCTNSKFYSQWLQKLMAVLEHLRLLYNNPLKIFHNTYRSPATRWKKPGFHPYLWPHTRRRALRWASRWPPRWPCRSCPMRRGPGNACHDPLSGPRASAAPSHGAAWDQKVRESFHRGSVWGWKWGVRVERGEKGEGLETLWWSGWHWRSDLVKASRIIKKWA